MKAVMEMQDASANSLDTYQDSGGLSYELIVYGHCSGRRTYFANSPYVLVPGFLVESKIFVEAEADIVSI